MGDTDRYPPGRQRICEHTHTKIGRMTMRPRKLLSTLIGWLYLVYYIVRNRFSRSSILGTADVVVSTTTYGPRLERSFAAIESVGRGAIRPREFILWIDSDLDWKHVEENPRFQRLIRRGLSVRRSQPMGPHSKYYPYVDSTQEHSLPLVTADDDSYYPGDWLKILFEAYRRNDRVIHCYRARLVLTREDGVAPYSDWPLVRGTEPSLKNCLTSVSGEIYPPEFLSFLRSEGEAFREVTPKNDDLWVHSRSVLAGYPTAQVCAEAVLFRPVTGSVKYALYNTNLVENDIVVSSVYTASVLSAMRSVR